MKLNLNTDFTKFPRAVSVLSAGAAGTTLPSGRAILAHDERHLRRRAIELADGGKVLVDLPEPVALNDGDRLVLENGGHIEIIAAPEEVYDIRARDGVHLAELAWHIGNRHLAAGIEAGRILILRDHVIKAMLEGLGATVTDVSEPFKPVRGAYSGHGGQSHDHGHAHAHSHAEAHSHSHGEARSHSHSHAGHHHDHD
ncbi:urease accessory protein UreE [Mesorhizobium sp. M7A.F.Ca.US.006.04.2.1]|uniref:urease accessory protein UreE n=1 Tax=unclassified Mesorhizobium TaxID=325217 RepID=UPI000FCA6A7F|nr:MULTISPECIES: urease accessory protein UreE [unclassified Mesorhizobium]RUX77693.1 urease accessory protein UreE [Mesorhizobium sp. M7A.F.Ca.US.005.03.1.1]RUY14571.1 urease accessory protein UreE [Mesorhizobium sp. M7A.F.Ca.US.005.03.2.1]RUY29420.1 urease accessory protein UreE [Mesorhizobium sp. M7A.F.Ca.US.001.04.2.1]RUY45063.1 urease accessory protein UreE [Mesorhizobium sp. M7A.F.Ca.US.001.04.1.1]RVA06781.1 urease accessory protein UreE [Mesorhizobium sp. M7A.F.Ca.US.001.02.1.1]